MLQKIIPLSKMALRYLLVAAIGYTIAVYNASVREKQLKKDWPNHASTEGLRNDVTLLESDNFYLPMIQMLSDPEVATQRYMRNKEYYQQRVAQVQAKHPNTPVCFAWGMSLIFFNEASYLKDTAYALVYDPRYPKEASAKDMLLQWKKEENYVYKEDINPRLRDSCPFAEKQDGTGIRTIYTQTYIAGYEYFKPLGDGYYAVSSSSGNQQNKVSFYTQQ